MMSGDLGPGVVRLRPDDQFMMLSERAGGQLTQLGALLSLETAPGDTDTYGRLRRHLAERMAGTPLQCRLLEHPEGYDSDVWLDVARLDLNHHITPVAHDGPWTALDLRAKVAELSLERLELSRAPFRIFVFEDVEDGQVAVYIKVHHALCDGIGFQTILSRLSDMGPVATPRTRDVDPPSPDVWRSTADARFQLEAPAREAYAVRRRTAMDQLERLKADPATRRPRTPAMKPSDLAAGRRAYATLSLPFASVKATAKALDGTLNDLFLAVCASALRRVLLELDDLPEAPLVVNSARSYRRPEHGAYGNRIVALHPHLATDLADPLQRFRAIQAEMRRELARTAWDEALLDQPERPYGPRDRRAKYDPRPGAEPQRLPGNVSLSNVPGPAEVLSYAGLRLVGNYPVPIIGTGRFLNITSRRNADRLDLGVMADPARIPDVEQVTAYVADALAEYEALA